MDNKLINKEVNEGKTLDLLAELNRNLNDADRIKDITVEDIGKFLKEEGVVVKVHAGRIRTIPGAKIKTLNNHIKKSIKDTQVLDFIENHISSGKIFFLPTELEANLIKIENGIRQKQRTLSLGYDNSFMPMKTFIKFKKENFDKAYNEFFELLDQICDNWDDIVEQFKIALKATLQALDEDNGNVYANAVNNIPSKEEYRKRFFMNLSVSAFPVMDNIKLFKEDIQAQMKDGLFRDTMSLIYEALVNILNDTFVTTCRLLGKEKITAKTWSGISNCIERINEKNIISNPTIKEISENLRTLFLNREKDIDILTEDYIEPILAQTFGYAKELGYADSIDFSLCSYSQKELSDFYSVLKF